MLLLRNFDSRLPQTMDAHKTWMGVGLAWLGYNRTLLYDCQVNFSLIAKIRINKDLKLQNMKMEKPGKEQKRMILCNVGK